MPVDLIRALLLKEVGFDPSSPGAMVVSPDIPKDIELLPSRLAVVHSRSLFVRFGQRAMQTCQYCTAAGDYALFTLSSTLMEYMRTSTLCVFLTTTVNGRERLRTIALGALMSAFLAEVYVMTSVSGELLSLDVTTTFMSCDNLFLGRHALFLVVPLLIQVLPPIYAPPPPTVTLAPALAHLEQALPRAHLLKYTRQAIMRNAGMRDRAVEWWTREARQGKAGREDGVVQKMAEKLGFGFTVIDGQDGKLRSSARMAVESLKPFFEPPQA